MIRNKFAFKRSGVNFFIQINLRALYTSLHGKTEYGKGDNHGKETGKDYPGDNGAGCNLSADPEHDGGHITNGRPCAPPALAARTTMEAKNHRVSLSETSFLEQCNHDNGGCQIIQGSRHEKGEER